MLQSYRLAGLSCHDDPQGVSHAQTIPGTVGRVTVINTDDGLMFIRDFHVPYLHSLTYLDEQVWWPSCATEDDSSGRQPTSYEKLVILGGHVSLRNEEMAEVLCGNIDPRTYPAGVGRRVLRSAQNHFPQ